MGSNPAAEGSAASGCHGPGASRAPEEEPHDGADLADRRDGETVPKGKRVLPPVRKVTWGLETYGS